MQQFDVEVYGKYVVVKDRAKGLKMYDVSADVDGELWRYCIHNKTKDKCNKTWRERGLTQAYYHAKNSGSYVTFHPVSHKKRTRTFKHHKRQQMLFS